MTQPDFLKTFDGTNRTPRAVQVQALNWVAENWDSGNVLCLQIPVGGGKSAIAKAIQQTVGSTSIIAPSNILLDAYATAYPEDNTFKGKEHYTCNNNFLVCGALNTEKDKKCKDCPYYVSKRRAVQREPTVFNPMSLYSLIRAEVKINSEVVIVDEAHLLPGFISMMCGKTFAMSEYAFDASVKDEVKLVAWLGNTQLQLAKLKSLYVKAANSEKVNVITQEMGKLDNIIKCFRDDPTNYSVSIEKGFSRNRPETFLKVQPIKPPQPYVKALLGNKRIILLSGTLLKTDIEDLLGKKQYSLIDLPSPIPKANRPVLYKPVDFKVNADTDPALLAAAIEACLVPGLNTVIHVSYAMSRKVLPHLKTKVISNSAEDKNERLAEFKKEGGVFLAAGLAEGIDLADDLCRLQIIPQIMVPSLGDPVVLKRKAMADGSQWYDLCGLKTLMQQVGRSTRHEKDHSKVIILDPRFSSQIVRHKKALPRAFVEAVTVTGG